MAEERGSKQKMEREMQRKRKLGGKRGKVVEIGSVEKNCGKERLLLEV